MHLDSQNNTDAQYPSQGHWKGGFLAICAEFFVLNNIIRPVRFTAAVAVSPQLDRAVAALQQRLGLSKGVAKFLTVLLLNVVGTTLFMYSGIVVAALAAGVPGFPPK